MHVSMIVSHLVPLNGFGIVSIDSEEIKHITSPREFLILIGQVRVPADSSRNMEYRSVEIS
jgi:hypothetical protein